MTEYQEPQEEAPGQPSKAEVSVAMPRELWDAALQLVDAGVRHTGLPAAGAAAVVAQRISEALNEK